MVLPYLCIRLPFHDLRSGSVSCWLRLHDLQPVLIQNSYSEEVLVVHVFSRQRNLLRCRHAIHSLLNIFWECVEQCECRAKTATGYEERGAFESVSKAVSS